MIMFLKLDLKLYLLPEQNHIKSRRIKIDKCRTPNDVEAKSTCDGPKVV